MRFDTVLLDADILLYSVGFATQKNIYHAYCDGHQGDPSFVMSDKRKLNKLIKGMDCEIHKYLDIQPFLSASITLDQIVAGYKKRFSTQDVRLFLTGDSNFRDKVATIQPYKGNRSGTDKPVHYAAIKDYLVKKYKAQVVEGQEADDAMAIAQTSLTSSVICTIDKDLDMVKGYHYNPLKDKLYHVDHLEGQRWFYEQLLQGDATDNIPGIPRIGKVTAKKLLENFSYIQEMENLCTEKYVEHYGDDSQSAMVEVGQLLWMRLHEDEMWYPDYAGGPRIEPQGL